EGNYVCVTPGVPIYGSNPQGSPPFNVFAVDQNLQTPMYHFFHATVQHEVFKNNVVTLSYVGSLGRDMLMYRDLNAPPIGSDFGSPQVNRPYYGQFPEFKHIIQLTNDGKSWYNSMQVSWHQQNWKGINTQYNFTWAKCEDYNSINRGSRTNSPELQNPYVAASS